MLGDVQRAAVSPVFVGRTEELAALTDALDRAHAGQPQALLLGGEAGVGKTRLIEEFRSLAEADQGTTALGNCVEIGADGLPFAPVVTVLRALRRQLGEEVTRAAHGHESELARLLPELGDTGQGPDDEDGRTRLFALTARLLERLATERTVVIVVEDAHWADRSTRELLGYLIRSLRRARLVLVTSYRSDDIHRRHPLRPFLAEIDRMRTVRHIKLARFTRGEVRAQITAINGAPPDESVVDRVFERTDGNAFFVEEVARSMSAGFAGGLSDSLRDLLLVRVEALSEEAQRVVRIAAEAGSRVEHALLAAVARIGEDELIEALRAAVGANILLASDDDGYAFRHALVREAVRDDLLPGETVRLNRRYAEALEADPTLVRPDEYATRLASYWYHAHDPAKALPAVLDASVEARARYAHAEQLGLLERALELWDTVPAELRRGRRHFDHPENYLPRGGEDEPVRYLDLLAQVVVTARVSGRRERAYAVVRRALREIDERTDPLRAAWFLLQRMKLVEGLARGDGRAELDRAQELLRGLPPSGVHAEVLAQAAAWGATHEPGAETYAAAEHAVRVARLVGVEGIELHARLTLAALRVDSGAVEHGLAEMAAVCERVVERREIVVLSRCFVNLASSLEGVGRSAEAVRAAERGIAVYDRFGLVDAAALAYGNQAESLLALGRLPEAEQAAASARRLAQSTKVNGIAAWMFARLALGRGDLDTAAAELTRARESYGSHDPQPQHTLPLTRLAVELATARGDLAAARSALAEVLPAGFPPGTQRYAWPLLLASATAEAESRGLPAAEAGRGEVLAEIRSVAKRVAQSAPVWRAYARMVEVEVARAEGRDTAAEWADVVAAFDGLDFPYPLALARLRWAEAALAGRLAGGRPLEQRGRATSSGAVREEAGRALARVLETARRLAARSLAESVAALAARARLTVPDPWEAPERVAARPGRRTPIGALTTAATTVADQPAETPAEDPMAALGLTSRERDVLRLVAVGRSNRQIAEELFISPKTASVHVSNILAKLQVSGRGEAAALAHRLRLGDAAPPP